MCSSFKNLSCKLGYVEQRYKDITILDIVIFLTTYFFLCNIIQLLTENLLKISVVEHIAFPQFLRKYVCIFHKIFFTFPKFTWKVTEKSICVHCITPCPLFLPSFGRRVWVFTKYFNTIIFIRYKEPSLFIINKVVINVMLIDVVCLL